MGNPYIPALMRREEIVLETEDRTIETFVLGFVRKEDREHFTHVPGQFAEVSLFSTGEAPSGMASTPTHPERPEFNVSAIGTITGALHTMERGENHF